MTFDVALLPLARPILPAVNLDQLTSKGSDRLTSGYRLYPNQYILSMDGRFALVLQADGNLVLYGPGVQPLWSSGTAGRSVDFLFVQDDGNVVLYGTGSQGALWSTSTEGNGQAEFRVQEDGNIVVYRTSDWSPVWSSGTVQPTTGGTPLGTDTLQADQWLRPGKYLKSADGRYTLFMQADGNLVLWAPGKRILWTSGTGGRSNIDGLLLQYDGNLVLYAQGPIWASNTVGGSAPFRLTLQGDANLVLYDSGSARWATNTSIAAPPVSPPPPPPDLDRDTIADTNDWCPKVQGFDTNHGCPNNIIQVSGDFDGDGKDDIVAVSRGYDDHPSISWFHSNGNGLDAPQLLKEMPAPAWNVSNLKFATGDFNGDGKDDLFAASGSSADPPNLYIFTSTGSGLSDPVLVKQPNPQHWQWPLLEFFPADLDGDGKDDILAVSRSPVDGPDFSWFRSTGSGLDDPRYLMSPNPAAWKVPNLKFVTGDFNGDGKDDLFAASGAGNSGINMYYFMSTGSGLANPVLVQQPSPGAWLWERLQWHAGDFDGDNKADIIAISRNFDNGPDISWFRSTGMALADPVWLKSLPSAAWKIPNLKWAIVDYDGDGKDDIFTASGSAADPVNMYTFRSTGSTLADPVLRYQPSPQGWLWERLAW